MTCWTILLAAGTGSRMAPARLPVRKQFHEHQGVPLFWHSARTFSRVAGVAGIVFVLPPDGFDEALRGIEALLSVEPLGLDWTAVPGGERRQDSVRCGVAALPQDCGHVLIHDAARPFVPPYVVAGVLNALKAGHRAVIPAVPVADTIKVVEHGQVADTPPRDRLVAVQTPQGLDRVVLEKGLAKVAAEGVTVTDDAALAEALGVPVVVTPGSPANLKITTPEDLAMLSPKSPPPRLPRVGFGYDVHRYLPPDSPEDEPGRPMILGGAPIPGAPRVIAHSDGDVLLHALADALLGCLGQGDIGLHFPDTDPAFSGIESSVLVSEVLARFAPAELTLHHVDLTIVAQIPRIAPHRDHIRRNVAGLLGLSPEQVNVKASTEEHLGFTGAKLGIKCYAVATALGR